ncbi:MAG: hypothetical protein WBD22_05100 [Pyrinomonadaceae bacterium]
MSDQKDIPELRLDKTKLKVVPVGDESDEIEYWRNTTIKERLQHAERLRRIAYGARATARLQRTLQIVKREGR